MYHSYKNLFKIRFMMYNAGNIRLPRPIPLDGAVVFLLMYLPSKFLAIPFAALFHQPLLGMALVIDGFLTWVILKYDPQGRPFLGFIMDFIQFVIRPKRRDFSGKILRKRRRMTLNWEAMDLGDK